MTKSNNIRKFSNKVKRPRGEPYLMRIEGHHKSEKKRWVILFGKKRLGYLKYIAEQSGIDMTGKCCLLKPGYDYTKPPTINDIEIITTKENLKRNSIHLLPKDIQSVIRSLIILTKRLNHEPRYYTALRKKRGY